MLEKTVSNNMERIKDPVKDKRDVQDVKNDVTCSAVESNKDVEQEEQISEVGEQPVKRHIECRNSSLEGDVHPVTGVPFERKSIEHDGEIIEGVFPQFEVTFEHQLDTEKYEASNKEQFNDANQALKEKCEKDPEFRKQFTEEQLEQIANGDRPDGYVWHHSEDPGKLQLVDKDTHDKTGHTGGQVIWGGGNDNR